MSSKHPVPNVDADLAELRASLFGGTPTAAPVREVQATGHAQPAYATPTATTGVRGPSAAEVLEASPNAQRLCRTYVESRALFVRRGRTQRLGVAGLVAALMISAAVLALQGRLGIAHLTQVVLGTAAVSILALGVLAVLWKRDEQRRRDVQGERLVRALSFNCSLPADRIEAFFHGATPTQRFFECHAVWSAQQAANRPA